MYEANSCKKKKKNKFGEQMRTHIRCHYLKSINLPLINSHP